MSLPVDVQAAVDLLAEYGASRAADEGVERDRLRAWIAGAVEAQVMDPDHEQAAEVELD